jgi:uncharacterized protein (TIGR02118 family)
MVQLLVLYKSPKDPQHFQDYYYTTHVPIAKKIPGLVSYVVSDGDVKGPDGSPGPYELVAQLTFDSPAALQVALGSPEGAAAVDDLQNFATGGVSIVAFTTRSV